MSSQRNRNLNYIYGLDETMNQQMKQMIHGKIESFMKRVEEIKNIMENKDTETETLTTDMTKYESLKSEQSNQDNNDSNKYYMELVKGRFYDTQKQD